MKNIFKIIDFFLLPACVIRGIKKFPCRSFLFYIKIIKNPADQCFFLIRFLNIWASTDISWKMINIFEYFAMQKIDGMEYLSVEINA